MVGAPDLSRTGLSSAYVSGSCVICFSRILSGDEGIEVRSTRLEGPGVATVGAGRTPFPFLLTPTLLCTLLVMS